MPIYIYIYIYTHTHTHTNAYMHSCIYKAIISSLSYLAKYRCLGACFLAVLACRVWSIKTHYLGCVSFDWQVICRGVEQNIEQLYIFIVRLTLLLMLLLWSWLWHIGLFDLGVYATCIYRTVDQDRGSFDNERDLWPSIMARNRPIYRLTRNHHDNKHK